MRSTRGKVLLQEGSRTKVATMEKFYSDFSAITSRCIDSHRSSAAPKFKEVRKDNSQPAGRTKLRNMNWSQTVARLQFNNRRPLHDQIRTVPANDLNSLFAKGPRRFSTAISTSASPKGKAFVVESFGPGEMSEWFKEHAWKACVGETPPWVRIPLSPFSGHG